MTIEEFYQEAKRIVPRVPIFVLVRRDAGGERWSIHAEFHRLGGGECHASANSGQVAIENLRSRSESINQSAAIHIAALRAEALRLEQELEKAEA